MLSEHAVVLDSDDVVGVIWIVVSQMNQNLKFNSSLVLELLLVSNDFDSHSLSSFVIDTFQCLPEGALSEKINNLKPVGNVVLQNYVIVASFVIVSAIVLLIAVAFNFVRSKPKIIAKFIIDELTLFIFCEARSPEEVLYYLRSRQGKGQLIVVCV